MSTDPIFYNTLTRSKDHFKPLNPQKVGLYTCGPTVYNYLHVGNYRTYIFEDILRRTLEFLGYSVRHVMNITDVGHLTSQADEGEDKVELEAAKEGKTAWQIAEFYTKNFLEDSKKLNLLPPHQLCKATDNIPEQIELIRRLEAKGLTYKISDGVYFDTSRFPGYGRLMGPTYQEGLKAGARVEANPEKRNPSDFALWKFSPKDKKRQMEWNSPWGKGFPGWHIECSAMSMKFLGESFDIHCGGVDHIPIHHTNEIAQAEGATGKPFVKWWMHGEFLLMNSAKMAKSAGGFIRLQDLEAKGYDPLDYRYLCMTAHYRKQLDFSWESLDAAKTARARLRTKVSEWCRLEPHAPAGEKIDIFDRNTNQKIRELTPGPNSTDVEKWLEPFREDISEDLDMPNALSTLYLALDNLNFVQDQLAFVKEVERVLGLGLTDPPKEVSLSPELDALIARREEARRKKNFVEADTLRKQLAEKGITVEDTPQGQRWKRK